MPTGYTSDVANGKITTLRDFALQSARGMGALIAMRDEPWDAPIPERFEPSTKYYDEALENARADLSRLNAMSKAECAVAEAQERAERQVEQERYVADKNAQRDRYKAMIAQVEAWSTEADGIREFMLEQLRESIRFDCEGSYLPSVPEPTDPEEWRRERSKKLAHTIGYYEEERAKEIARTEARNRWLEALRASLPEAQAAE